MFAPENAAVRPSRSTAASWRYSTFELVRDEPVDPLAGGTARGQEIEEPWPETRVGDVLGGGGADSGAHEQAAGPDGLAR